MEFPNSEEVTQVLNTSFGIAWLMYGAFLLMAAMSKSRWLVLVGLMGMLLSMVLSSHAGDGGIGQLIFWIDFFHLGCVLIWLGGLTLMLVFRLSGAEKTTKGDLQFFSRLALPVFMLILGSGVTRAVFQYYEEGVLEQAYIVMLIIKIGLVMGVIACAWQLRCKLQQTDVKASAYDNGVSLEYFFAILLLLVTGLLTQLPPN
ncbi:CopD family protein [Methylobacillus caricis]|uniref:copper resistance D family protein n=1 Tax=Methylobacillus caricis TaxID=1971611 RepID=UPI001CFF799D|nr:CopD family protein [Methylobacillus caricis]MCB5186635.1 CopD family protein [Methylobacillus caricis]